MLSKMFPSYCSSNRIEFYSRKKNEYLCFGRLGARVTVCINADIALATQSVYSLHGLIKKKSEVSRSNHIQIMLSTEEKQPIRI